MLISLLIVYMPVYGFYVMIMVANVIVFIIVVDKQVMAQAFLLIIADGGKLMGCQSVQE